MPSLERSDTYVWLETRFCLVFGLSENSNESRRRIIWDTFTDADEELPKTASDSRTNAQFSLACLFLYSGGLHSEVD